MITWGEIFVVILGKIFQLSHPCDQKKEIYDFGFQEIKASIADSEIDTGFIHTPLFFLLDREKIVRGWYDGLDSTAQQRLVRDIPLLMLEKDRKKTFGEFLKELFGRS